MRAAASVRLYYLLTYIEYDSEKYRLDRAVQGGAQLREAGPA
jgi:hypothetical protein